jgi:CarD family transcriptional regulator
MRTIVMATAKKKSAKHASPHKARKKATVKAKNKPAPKKPAAQKPAAKSKTAPKPNQRTAARALGPKPHVKPAAPTPKPTAPARASVEPAKPASPAPAKSAATSQPPKPVAAAPKTVAAAPKTVAAAPKKLPFKVSELIVYPAHGVGRIVQIEEQEIAGAKLELYIIDFEKEKLRLKVPTGKSEQKGMRKLADKALIEQAMRVLKGRARIKRTMWSRRAQEYEAKINSGDLIAVAEVVRDLYRSEKQPEQSYSERQLFEQALERMAREIGAVKRIDDDAAVKELEAFLEKNAHRNVKTEEEPAPAEAAA